MIATGLARVNITSLSVTAVCLSLSSVSGASCCHSIFTWVNPMSTDHVINSVYSVNNVQPCTTVLVACLTSPFNIKKIVLLILSDNRSWLKTLTDLSYSNTRLFYCSTHRSSSTWVVVAVRGSTVLSAEINWINNHVWLIVERVNSGQSSCRSTGKYGLCNKVRNLAIADWSLSAT